MKNFGDLIILGIESSCDETAAAVLKASRGGFKILASVVSSQIATHRRYGGVVPEVAARMHVENIVPVLGETMETAGVDFKDINLIAATRGPGLVTSLLVGLETAKNLAYFLRKPIVGVNHVVGHLLVSLTNQKEAKFPAMALVVSGGHTQLVLVRKIGDYEIIGETLDDAAGECFDKVAKILNLGYPGGPVVAAEAEKYPISNIQYPIRLPRPMLDQKNYNFSFSGLKTAVLYNFQKQKPAVQKDKHYIRAMCHEAQQAIVNVLVGKTLRAARDYGAETVILAGGVAANKALRETLAARLQEELPRVKYLQPSIVHCTDNAVMIAVAGYYQFMKNKKGDDIFNMEVDPNLRVS